MQLGITTFGEVTTDRQGRYGYATRARELMAEAELADQVGLDVFGIGERHHPQYMASAPAVILAAAAARTKRIRLTSAVTVLSSDDPVRVFQDFATLDLLSGGRAEIIAGRGGQATDSFPLFGYGFEGYDAIFEEKLALLLEIRDAERVTWTGEYRPPIQNLGIYPRPVQERLPVWVAVTQTVESALHAASLGLPIVVAIIGKPPRRFRPLFRSFREAASAEGHDPEKIPIAVCSRGHIALRPRTTVEDVRSPQEVIDSILEQHRLFGHQRHLIYSDIARLPHKGLLRTIELLGTRVAPVVRRETAQSL